MGRVLGWMRNLLAQSPNINWLAALLSAVAFPGVGQLIKGEIFKGMLILVGLPLGLFVAVVTYFFSVQAGLLLTLTLVLVYFWNIYDAFSHVRATPQMVEGRGVKWQ
jgi:TM2 domain-containing membrane protein YozV